MSVFDQSLNSGVRLDESDGRRPQPMKKGYKLECIQEFRGFFAFVSMGEDTSLFFRCRKDVRGAFVIFDRLAPKCIGISDLNRILRYRFESE